METPPHFDGHCTQTSLHRTLMGDGYNLVHVWDLLPPHQDVLFREVVSLPPINESQTLPHDEEYFCDSSLDVWDVAKETKLNEWGIYSKRMLVAPGEAIVLPAGRAHVFKKIGTTTTTTTTTAAIATTTPTVVASTMTHALPTASDLATDPALAFALPVALGATPSTATFAVALDPPAAIALTSASTPTFASASTSASAPTFAGVPTSAVASATSAASIPSFASLGTGTATKLVRMAIPILGYAGDSTYIGPSSKSFMKHWLQMKVFIFYFFFLSLY